MARVVLTAATETPRVEGAPSEQLPGKRFHTVIGVEGVWTGDGRYFEPGAYVWRDLPLPFMADDENRPMHENAKLVGNLDTIERVAIGDEGMAEIHGWGAYVTADEFGEDADRVRYLQGLVDRGELRGVSADMDDPEWEVVIPAAMMSEGAVDDEGNLHLEGSFPKEIYSSVRIIGATALPFPALQDAYVEPVDTPDDDEEAIELEDNDEPATVDQGAALDALASSGHHCTGWVARYKARLDPIVAGGHPWVKAPVCPPAAWFDDLTLDAPTPITLTDEGEYFGHIALWGQCHIGRAGECVMAPASRTNYAHFHLGEIACDDGTRVACGNLTLDDSHADLQLGLGDASRHYDHTGTQVAQIRCGEDQFGIWAHGALCPDVSARSVRRLMAAPPSGDWRRLGGSLEMVAVLSVNVPGFQNKRQKAAGVHARVFERNGMVASLVVSTDVQAFLAPRPPLDPDTSDAVLRRIAASIGRAPHQRIAQLRQRVHGGAR